jgi:hypothetical protein
MPSLCAASITWRKSRGKVDEDIMVRRAERFEEVVDAAAVASVAYL